MDIKSYTEVFTVQNTDVDFCGRMRPGALLRCVEQVSAGNAREGGYGEDFLLPRGLALLVGKQALRFERVPVRGEKLAFTTMPEQSRRASMKRLTVVYDEAKRLVATVDARWILVSTAENRILREPTWDTSQYWNECVEGELPQSVHRVENSQLERVGKIFAGYSLCDEHGHINNSRYLDIACDALPLGELRTVPVSFAAVKYNKGVLLGEDMEVCRARSAAGWYVAGKREGKTAFECYLEIAAQNAGGLRT